VSRRQRQILAATAARRARAGWHVYVPLQCRAWITPDIRAAQPSWSYLGGQSGFDVTRPEVRFYRQPGSQKAAVGRPNVEVAGLTIVPGKRARYAASHGLSAWRLGLGA
jgi:hypothetical protein